jgi:hypothetical protein
VEQGRVAVAAAALVGGLLIAQQVAGRALRDALFLSAYSVTSLPGMILVSAVVSVCGSLAFASALARRPPAWVLTRALGLQIALLVAEPALAADHPRLVAAALYVQLALLGPGILSGFWSLVNESFDPYTARRVVGEIGTGASIGGVVGGALAWAGARMLPVPALFIGLAAACGLALIALRRLRPAGARQAREEPAGGGVADGLRSIRQFPYLRQLATLVALGALAEVLLDYLLKAGAVRAFAGGGALARFFGLFYACVALVTVILQAALARPSLERLGLAGTVGLQPTAVALAAAAGLAFPSFGVAIAARGLGNALRDSLFRSGYELCYTPLPPWQKRRSKALVDVAADKLGTLVGAGLVIVLVRQWLVADRWLWLLALVAMLASVLVARRLHQGYVLALEGSLRSGLVELEPEEVVDSTTRQTLTRTALDRESLLAEIRALRGEPAPLAPASPGDGFLQLAQELRSGHAERIRSALLRMGSPDPALAHLIVALLERDDVFPQVLRALRRGAPRMTGLLVDALADPQQPAAVRRRIPRVLKASPSPRAVDGLVLGLSDADFAVRRSCAVVLVWMRARHAELAVPAAPVYAAAARELDHAGADPVAQLDLVFDLLGSVGDCDALRAARWALRGEDQHLRGTALEYLEQVLPEAVRRPLLRRLGATPKAPARPRGKLELEDDLRRSLASLPRGRPRS